MKGFPLEWLLAALAVHAVVLLFGGLFFVRNEEAAVRENVELVTEEITDKKRAEEQEPEGLEEAEESIAEPDEPLPDVRELARLETPLSAPALAPLSLADLEGLLDSGGWGGAFAVDRGLSSGGRIGGTGSGMTLAEELGEIASLADLDQRPRAIFQTAPNYPIDLRKRNLEGTVQVVFLVDRDGRVANPKIERSTNPAFERPALEAVRQWKFEPGTRNGEKVAFKMRIPITFSAS